MHSKVQLVSFNGLAHGPEDGRPGDNYWALIGQTGVLLAPANAEGRVLVKFDQPIFGWGLQCHNPVDKSLLILYTDLKKQRAV